MKLFPGRVSYLLILLLALADAVWIGISNISFPMGQLINPILSVFVLSTVCLVIYKRKYADNGIGKLINRVGYFFQGIIFLQVSWIVLRLFNHISMSSNFPYVDKMLDYWDKSLGLEWEKYYHSIMNNEFIYNLMGYSYTSLTFFSFIGFFILIAQGKIKRTRFFLDTFLVTAVLCTVIGIFFPAKGTVAMYYGDEETIANLLTLPGVFFFEHLERARSGVAFSLDLNNLPGLVAFPSFHTAAGIILVISFWRTALFPIALLYSSIMIAATPVLGGHYFVDLISGSAIAILVAYAFGSRPYYQELFRRKDIRSMQPENGGSQLPASG